MNSNSCMVRFAMKYCLHIIFYLLGIVPLQAQKPATATSKGPAQVIEERKITYRIIGAPNKTFCYDIFMDGRLLIHQPSIPGLPGKQGFTRKSDADKVASLVIKKIENGIMPPTIESKELDSLEIKY